MGQGRAMDQVASQHTGAMMDALAAAKKQGGWLGSPVAAESSCEERKGGRIRE